MRIAFPLLAPITLVTACVGAPPPPPAVAAAPVPVAPPLPAPTPAPVAPALKGDWRDWPLTPGDWVYRQDARGSIALFGRPGSDAEVTLRCDRAASLLYLSRRGAVPGNAPMTVRTSSVVRTLATRPTGGTPAYVAVTIAPRDGLLDAMGFSRGRFVIEQAGMPVLVVPAWAEILRVVEDCRG